MKRADLLASLDIGRAIKKLRESKGLSQEELAQGICDRTNITKLENGYYKVPSLSFVLLICDKLQLTIDQFLNFAMENSYSLDRTFILDALMNHSYVKLKEYIGDINVDLLSAFDKRYYEYLLAKIALNNGEIDVAKNALLDIVSEKKKDFIYTFALYDLLKFRLIDYNKGQDIYSKEYITSLLNRNESMECLAFINDLLQDAILARDFKESKWLLTKQIEFINSHECYKYLSNYYKNKIWVYSDDLHEVKDIELKLFSLERQ